MFWIDMHCHFPMLEQTPDEVIQEAYQNNVHYMITIGTNPQDHQETFDIAKKYFPNVACALGIHPHDALEYTPEVQKFLQQKAKEHHVVALGEIGLDYYYKKSPIPTQKEAFEKQLEIALSLNLPVQIHTRDAQEDTIAILKNFSRSKTLKGTIHCFTGTQYLADKALEMGLDISFSGIVTFKNAQNLQQVAKNLPIDRIHIETDSPFLTPTPHRGKKNAPSFLIHTAKFLAHLKQIPIASFQKQLQKNAQRAFPKLSFLTHKHKDINPEFDS